MEERLLFVARLLEGESKAEACRSFGISRKTGYKIFNRYKEHGLEALTDRSRRKASIISQVASGVLLGNEWGREEWSCKPARPSARNRRTHLATVFGVV